SRRSAGRGGFRGSKCARGCAVRRSPAGACLGEDGECMGSTMRAQPLASQRDSLADIRPEMARAELDSQVSASEVSELASEAAKRTHGKALAAAAKAGLSESHFGRLLNEGDLKLKQ